MEMQHNSITGQSYFNTTSLTYEEKPSDQAIFITEDKKNLTKHRLLENKDKIK